MCTCIQYKINACSSYLMASNIFFRKPVPLILDQEYVNLKNQIIKAERRVLKELGFCVHVKHPHKVCIAFG